MFRDYSLRAQLIALILLVCTLALTVAGVTLFVNESLRSKKALTEELTSLAALLAERSSAALVFTDEKTASDNLNALSHLEHIGSACMFNEQGSLFVSFSHGAAAAHCKVELPLAESVTRYEGTTVQVQMPVRSADRVIGAVQIHSTSKPLLDSLKAQLLSLALALSGALILAVLLTLRLQRIILRPLAQVREVATSIVNSGEYSLRAPDLGRHELGELAAAFNRMLLTIETQNKELAESEAYTRRLFYDSPIPQLVVDPETQTYIDCNQAAVEVHGFQSREALIGKGSIDVLAPEQEDGDASSVINARRTDFWQHGLQHTELRYRRQNGELWDGLISMMALTLKGRQFLHISVQDITERKQATLELTRYRDNLEQLVKERTAELQLARDTAEKASRSKSVFLSNMSHELRTPLNAILGFAQLVARDGSISEDSRKKLSVINHAGEHLLELINEILEISRIEAGRSVTHIQPFSIAELLGSVEELIRIRAEEKGLQFAIIQAQALPLYVNGDEHHIRQILINLLSNAVKYTDQGSVRLVVQGENTHISFQVIDTGPGIDAKDQDRIFEAFYQTEEGIKKGEGTGLGLAISQKYAQLMGGSLSVSSRLGEGSTFNLTLPLPETAPPLAEENSRPVAGLLPGQEGLRILVVDDQSYNQELLKTLLELVGFEVRTADNGQQAIALFQSWHPRLICMDMRMPVMDGYQATRNIRALPGGQQVKIIALTASAFEEDKAAILQAGCDEVVSKPFNQARLFAVMGALLGLHYRYAGETAAATSVAQEPDFSSLSKAQLERLVQAADALDLNLVRRIADEIGSSHADIAQQLHELMQKFRFDKIVSLCNAALQQQGSLTP